MRERRPQYLLISTILGFACATSGHARLAMGQSTPTPRQRPARTPSQPQPVSLPHLYWHFLEYQHHLDTKASELAAQGKDSSRMRSYLQSRLALSDADFAPVRISSARLGTEVEDLDAKALAIQAAGKTPANLNQLKVLDIQREADINAEVAYLKQSLSPDQIKAFELFLTDFFSPANAMPRPPSIAVPAAIKAVQP